MTPSSNSSYEKMLQDVEAILQGLNQDKWPLDEMVAQVEKGYELIEKMHQRLNETKTKIETLKENFENKDKPTEKSE